MARLHTAMSLEGHGHQGRGLAGSQPGVGSSASADHLPTPQTWRITTLQFSTNAPLFWILSLSFSIPGTWRGVQPEKTDRVADRGWRAPPSYVGSDHRPAAKVQSLLKDS